MSGVTTDSIKTNKYEAKVAAEQKKLQAKQEAIRKENEKKAAAADLVNSLAGYSDESKVRKVRGDIKDNLKEMYKDGQITKEEYEAAKSYANSGEYKSKLKSEITSEARILTASVAVNSDGKSIGQVKDDVKDALKQKLDSGEITEAQYKAAKKYTKTGTGIGRFFGVKEKESRQMFQVKAYQNELQETKEKGPKFDAKLQAKLNLAGINTEQVYEIGDANGGAADATINYSWKKKQPGEMDAIQTAFNNNEADVHFSKKESNKIMKQAGYHVEKKVDAGKLLQDIGRGVLVGAPASYLSVDQTQRSIVNGVATVTNNQGLKVIGVVPAITGTAAGIHSAITQAHRVEDRAIPTNVPEGVTTYEQYAKYLDDNYSTSKGAALGKDIAKQYVKDGKLDVAGLNEALKKAAGTVTSTSTPLNHREALGLLMNSTVKTETPVTISTTEPEPETCEVTVTPDTKNVPTPVSTDCYKIQKGDNWFDVAKGKYNATDAEAVQIAKQLKEAYYEANKEELNKKGIKSAKGGFFPKVGDELCVPSTIKVGDKEFTYDVKGKVNAGTVDDNYKGATFKANGNIFTKDVPTPIWKGKTCDGTEFTVTTEEGIQTKVDELQEQNPNKKYVIVK